MLSHGSLTAALLARVPVLKPSKRAVETWAGGIVLGIRRETWRLWLRVRRAASPSLSRVEINIRSAI